MSSFLPVKLSGDVIMKKIYDQAISSLLYLMFRPKNQADDGKSQWSLITTLGFTLYSSI